MFQPKWIYADHVGGICNKVFTTITYEEIENDEEIKSVVILKERFISFNYAGKGWSIDDDQ